MDPAFAQRNVNEGFSGGEKKRHEIVQLELLKPKIAILDETDSGLDIDALRVVSEGVNRVRETGETGVLLITHYTRILRYIKPDFVHVFVGRPDRRGGRPGAGRAARGRGLRAVPRRGRDEGRRADRSRSPGMPQYDDVPRFDVAQVRADFPILEPGGQRAPAGLPRQRQHLAEAAQVLDAHARALRAAQRATCPGRCTRWAPRRPTAYEGARAKVAAFIGAPVAGRGGVHQELHRGDQPGGVRLPNASARTTRGSGSAPATRS